MKCPKCNDVFLSYIEQLIKDYGIYAFEYIPTLEQAPWCVHIDFPDTVPGVVCGRTLEEACEIAYNKCKEMEEKNDTTDNQH
jgi:hypothetical protein